MSNDEKIPLDMLKEALLELTLANEEIDALREKAAEPIAIIGLGCRFPGSSNTSESFWELLKKGVDGISEIPKERFDPDIFYDPESGKPNKIITKNGAFLENIDLFDPSFFGISPVEAEVMDPQQRLLLSVTWEALEYAGIAPKSLKNSNTGVFVGVSSNEYGKLIEKNTRALSSHFISGNALNALSGRLSFCLGLQGPSLIVDTACSSSLVALHVACKSLLAGDCDLAIVAGVNIILDPTSFIGLSSGQMLSPDGHCKTFDAKADGYARGEGIAVLIIKRLSHAIRDQDSILAVIRGTAVNQDGHSSGLTVPNGVAQAAVIRKALEFAKLEPLDISYVEAHGTGTSLGDPIEVNAIAEVYGELRSSENPLLIGSVKSNIGHLESAAGMSSLIKVILALNHQAIPGNLHFHHLNPKIDLNSIPAKIVTELTPWERKDGKKRIAGVSGFGFTGTNAHVLLEEAPDLETKEPNKEELPLHLLVLSAKSKNALGQLLKRYQDFLENTSENLTNITYTASTGRNHELFRLAVIAKDLQELKLKLKNSEYFEGQVNTDKIVQTKFQFQDSDDYHFHTMNNNVVNVTIGAHPNWQALLNELSSYYIVGAEIDWKSFYMPFNPRKIQLPTYPFEYQHFWSDLAVVSKPGVEISGDRHPFLVRKLITPGMKEIVYESSIDFYWPEFISHHLIYDYPVIAGAGYISALLSAINELSDSGSGAIMDLEWIRPLVFLKDEASILQIIFKQLEGENEYHFEAISRKQENTLDSDWLTHAAGQVKLNTSYKKLSEYESVENIKARLKTHYDGDFLYAEVTPKISLDLGSHFRWIEEVYVSADEVLAKMRLPEAKNESTNYILHPGFIDSVFQTGFAFMLFSGRVNILSIPLFIEKIVYESRLGYPRWIHAKKRREGNEELTDFILLNEKGEPVGEFYGFRTREVPKEALMRALGDVSGMMYESIWLDKPLDEVKVPDSLGYWLILGNGNVPETIKKMLENKGARTRCLSGEDLPKSKDEFLNVLKEETFDGILHAASAGDFLADTADQIKSAQEFGAKSFLYLVQALIELEKAASIKLFIITKDLYFGNYIQSPINGMFKTILLERPEISMKQIDVAYIWDENSFLRILGAEEGENIFSLRDNKIKVLRLIKEKLEITSENKIKSNATYCITGGLGGLGQTLAHWLLEKGATQIILTGRRPKDENIMAPFKNLPVIYETLDISNEMAVKQFLEKWQETEKPLKGIFHLAGIIDDATLTDQNWENFEKIFQAKVYGSFYLHRYSRNLDLFVLFSSISSTIGNPGQANYAAANSFMNTLCEYRQQQGLPAKSLAWGPWAEVGMAKSLAFWHGKGGMLPLNPQKGMLALERALNSSVATITIANIDWKNYGQTLINPPSYLANFIEKNTQDVLWLTQLDAVPEAEREGLLKKLISNLVKRILGIKETDFLDENVGFFEMGLDSLMAMDLKNHLENELGQKMHLPATFIFDYPTVSQILSNVVEKLKIKSAEGSETDEVTNIKEENKIENEVKTLTDEEILENLKKEIRGE